MSARASGADASAAGGGGGAKNRAHHDGSAGRAYTAEQKTAVVRIRRCAPTAFYEILGLEEVRTTCTDGEIKKAYRKLSLLTHPDKNGYDGADEAFKMVSRAFQILSDADKKAKYDRFGGDPDNRFGGGASSSASSPFSNFNRSSGARPSPMWEEEISPEEMFRQFFGGGMGGGFGGPFGGGLFENTGPGFVFNLGGGPGIRVHQFGGARPRRRPPGTTPDGQPAPPPSLASTLSSLLPLIFLFILPLLSSLFSGSGNTAAGPQMRFDTPNPPQTHAHVSSRLKLRYWVDPRDVEDYSRRQWARLDEQAEARYVRSLQATCHNEHGRREQMLQDAQGWFVNDEAKMREAQRMDMPACKRLGELNLYPR